MLICLTGYRGTGKSTIGRELASRLSIPFVDTDQLIEQEVGRPISKIFEDNGENVFRDLEFEIIARELKQPEGVISLGGGAILREETRNNLKTADYVIWLKAGLSTIVARLAQDPVSTTQRPNLTNMSTEDEIASLLEQRRPLYRECATLEIETDQKSPSDIVQEILCRLEANTVGGDRP